MSNMDRTSDTMRSPGRTVEAQPIQTASLDDHLQVIRKRTGNSTDIVFREIRIGKGSGIRVALVFTDGLVNETTIQDFIMEALMNDAVDSSLPPCTTLTMDQVVTFIADQVMPISGVDRIDDWYQLYDALFSGQTLVLVDGSTEILSLCTLGWEKRSIQEPGTDVIIRGPREGFVEILRTNTSMIRRRVKNPDLWLETLQLGQVTHTNIGIMYMKGIVDEKIVREVRKRLNNIKIDAILESGYIEKLIEDQSITPFPTVLTTERPDTVVANLLEGKVAILVDGTPFVLIVPAVFNQFFQIVEDYYNRFDISTALRILRIIIYFLSLLAPSIYIAATTFHQEMIPTELLISLAKQREAVPFPAFIEAFVMEVIFEILREAGVRLPKAVGPAVSIVGALVIGQAAVEAGFISPATVIVVSITAISSFATPTFAVAISARLLRFLFMVIAGAVGFYGLILAMLMLLAHLCGLRSFGVPYMSPVSSPMSGSEGSPSISFRTWITRLMPKLEKRKSTESVGEEDDDA